MVTKPCMQDSKRDTDISNSLLDSVGEGESGMIWENGIETCIISYVKRTPLPPPSPYHPSGSSQCTSPKHPVSYIKPGLMICFTYDIIHVSMPFSKITPPFPSPTESKRLFYTSVSLLLSHIRSYRYHLSKFHIYTLV